jgi:hypothetical protein
VKVWVQLGDDGLAVRIFSHQKEMFFECPAGREAEMERALATRQIRVQIWDRQNGTCIRCPTILTWENGHLHERVFRSQGGNISLDNSEMLCFACHEGEFGAHKNRQLKFTKRTGEEK